MTRQPSSRTEVRDEPIMTTALETLMLWPGGPAEVDALRDVADPWPVFVVVVGTDSAAGAQALSQLLATPRSPIDTVVNSDCWWSIVEPDQAMLSLAVRVTQPIRVTMDIAVPAQCFLGLSDIVAAGATIGVTTRRHARRLTVRTDDPTTLEEIVLLGGRTSSELGEVAKTLWRMRPQGGGDRVGIRALPDDRP